jgi:hypothetical protein
LVNRRQCRRCENWVPGKFVELEDGTVFQEFGECTLARMWNGKCVSDSSIAYAVSQGNAMLMTAPEFGCNQFRGSGQAYIAWPVFSRKPIVIDTIIPVEGAR